ncbi:pentatricopeptide repeat-containing protein 1, mitochondrial [Ceratina calcarata]|uniref:Pentatricopeptide repeat-containing protein 1, mitochondrial n=1 Tax=Ceratina calcarata TaxID=156304 RepID=A0AAJ7IT27_9HYME|nr:pentatricopeptide repeat-containing protein 1, mitochondrial [Ceratina calcarata]
MLFQKTNRLLKSKFFLGYIDCHYHHVRGRKQFLCTVNTCNYMNNKRDNTSVQREVNPPHLFICCRSLCTKALPENPNVFGDLSYEKYEKVPMDEAEEKEEKFAETVKVPKRERFTQMDYCKLIKTHMNNKNLQMALNVLDLMKENGDKPSLYIYRLLLSAFAIQGDMKQCFKLFKQIRDRGLSPTPSVYNTLIHVCSESDDKEKALERLTYLREYFHERQVSLNHIHYASLIKAYSRHKEILTAFEIADEANDKGICSKDMIAALFQATISDTKNGLKYALALWHKMKLTGMKPTIIHYNLLLRTIRDSKFGDLKVGDVLVPQYENSRIQLTETGRPDLLDSPPVLNLSLIPPLNRNLISSENNSLPEEINTEKLCSLKLNTVLNENQLILFGGIDKILKRMKDDGVEPNQKTVTLLLDLLPCTVEAEDHYLKFIETNHIKMDITFYNVLIKRRSLRRQYKEAKAVLNEIQKHHLSPNVITFGVLAIGCRKYWDGMELLEQMDAIGYAPNYIVLQALFMNACIGKDFKYVLNLMQYLLKRRMKPPPSILNTLEKFDEIMLQSLENEGRYKYKNINEMRKKYNDFKIKYENWKEKIQKYSEKMTK